MTGGTGVLVAREVLLADDDRELRRLLAQALAREGYLVTEVDSGDGLLDRVYARERGFDLIISDVRMPGFTGLEAVEALRDSRGDGQPPHDTPVILISAFGGSELAESARRLGAQSLDKPFDVDELLAMAHDLILTRGELDASSRT